MPGPLASLLDRFGSRPGWVIALDLILVYYLIYRVLRAIRGTRAAQMAVGIALVAAGFYAARRLELVSVSWLLDNVLSYLILIVIVVFQADIRRALGRLGQGVMPTGRADDVGQVVDEVAAAVAQLARARRGAIIVLEREADLTGFVEDATRLDAALSRQLLVALFVATADNELHDGAVVIGRNRRIAVARALLPLSRAAGLGPELGTRHRAALGITEDTDAIAVVVSEERGQVSVCFHGRVARDLDGQTLRRALLELYGGGGAAALAAAEVGAAVATLGRERAAEGS